MNISSDIISSKLTNGEDKKLLDFLEHTAYIIVTDDGSPSKLEKEKRYPLTGEDVLLGSSLDATICLPEAGLAPYHVQLFFYQGDWHLKDLTQSLEIKVNGSIVTHWVFSQDGETIQLGRAQFQFFLGISEGASYIQTLFERSILDGLTKVYNRRYFDEKLAEELDRCPKNNIPLSLVLIDLDNFHDLNEQYGHTGGDAVLKEVVVHMSSHLRKSRDIVARYGGEEFAIILPGANAEQAFDVAERIRASLDRSPIKFNDQSIAVTMSAGVTTTYHKMANIRFIENADTKLAMAKSMGKNQVIK